MLVTEVMTTDVVTCNPEDTVDSVARLMVTHDCGAVPVCDGSRLVGILTDRDITCRAVATGRSPAAIPVNEIMTKTLFTIESDEDAEAAVALMKEQQVRRLPVVDSTGALIGIISPSDLAPMFASHDVADFLLAVSYWSRREGHAVQGAAART